MNYAWEAVLSAEQNNRNRNSLHFVDAVTPSPYMEVSAAYLNAREPEGDVVEINPLYRFEDVFGKLFDRNTDEMAQTRALFFDICMHYIVQLDLRQGLSKEDYHYCLIEEDIMSGRYGEMAKSRFGMFERHEQKLILRSYLRLLKTGNYLEEFKKTVSSLYKGALIYEDNETPYELLVYLGTEDTDTQHERALFLRDMFMPIQETVHFFYANHFGIIGVEETMLIDEMVIF